MKEETNEELEPWRLDLRVYEQTGVMEVFFPCRPEVCEKVRNNNTPAAINKLRKRELKIRKMTVK